MASPSSKPERGSKDDPQEDIARLLAVLIRLQVENQTKAILTLSGAGFAPPRITQLLGLPPDVARSTINKAQAAKAKAPKKGTQAEGQDVTSVEDGS